MIDKDEFVQIREDLARQDQVREDVIQRSREIIKDSKVAIYSIHRHEADIAAKKISEMKKKLQELKGLDADTGIKGVAFQEYVEAAAFLEFVNNKRLLTLKEAEVDAHNYLAGLCDLTGELMRLAVNSVIAGENERVKEIRELIEGIYGEFLQMNLPNGELRKKSDSIKWNLSKVEDIIYNLKLKGSS